VLHLTLANLRAKPGRFIATMLAIIVGTGFLAGTLVLSDSLGPALKSNAESALKGVDAAVEPRLESDQRQARRGAAIQTSSLPAGLLTTVQQAEGVQAAAGNLSAPINVLGPSQTTQLKHANGTLWVSVPALNPYRIVSGRAPLAAGQIAVDQETANSKHWSLGTSLDLATASGTRRATVVGISRYGQRASSTANGDILISRPDAFSQLGAGQQLYDTIYVQARSGVTEDQLVANLSKAIGTQYTVQTGDDLRTQAAADTAALVSFIGTALQIFAWIALGVSVLIIYNTFSIVVAQRVREFALLRALGAQGPQVRHAVWVEAIVVGLVASAIGVVVGVGLFLLLLAVVPILKNITSSGGVGLVISPTSVIEVLIVGLVVTLVSATVPAFRAARTRPMEALRIALVDQSGTSRLRGIIGLVTIGLGAVVLLGGMAAKQGLLVALGPILLFLGTLIAGPVLARGFASAVGAVLGRFGMPSRLAVSNTRRNPSRTATTANALVIGMFLVVFVTAAGGAIRDYAVNALSQFSTADLTVSSSSSGLSPTLQRRIHATAGIQSAVPIYGGIGRLVGSDENRLSSRVSAADPEQVANELKVKSDTGDLATLADDEIAVPLPPGNARRRAGPPPGSTVTVVFKNGVTKTFKVAVETEFSLDITSDLVSTRAAQAADPDLLPTTMAIIVKPGQLDSVKNRLDQETAAYSTVSVNPGNEIALLIKSFFNAIISSVNALLAFAIAIAVFGIVNTLILSVTERTPEIGLLRSVGMSRRQLQRTIRSESVILAADGTVLGMVFGLFVAWAVTQPLFTGSQSFSWPWRELGVIALIGLAIGLLASLIPAWRAARIDILDAVATE
jgi:putative ABC transport system permease protein